ncbi:class I SAM-dependent methyltransferase [Alkalilimnicola ehrlichii MLHE-1]|uniref:Methyltransferase type 11 n=1 Tax=Alkalilimnicola ehrlichii (strain ATCC BAA-1101 / DSM 17681 / MLHE-1) TaxID=187272 RepID=Q0AB07_ALKEH|nr:class I SAM-dependent methyltransferase [Alkalilimnicola ehrlichii]ABI55980.1 Methyltransferase type 11 [Alkalilimnicola ehrlichii MLHE-1]
MSGRQSRDHPAGYEAWYHSPRGRWVAKREFDLLFRLLRPALGSRVLDVGCGTGHFTRRFAQAGLDLVGLDPDGDALRYARSLDDSVAYVRGDARTLPFPDGAFANCIAITSLCFVESPEVALAEMARVAREGVALGLLHRPSLLHWQKAGRGGYRGARWDRGVDLRRWFQALPGWRLTDLRWGLFCARGPRALRAGTERMLPDRLPLGAFMAAVGRPVSDGKAE